MKNSKARTFNNAPKASRKEGKNAQRKALKEFRMIRKNGGKRAYFD